SGSIGGGVDVPLGRRVALRLEARGYATAGSAALSVSYGAGATIEYAASAWFQLGARGGVVIRLWRSLRGESQNSVPRPRGLRGRELGLLQEESRRSVAPAGRLEGPPERARGLVEPSRGERLASRGERLEHVVRHAPRLAPDPDQLVELHRLLASDDAHA